MLAPETVAGTDFHSAFEALVPETERTISISRHRTNRAKFPGFGSEYGFPIYRTGNVDQGVVLLNRI